MIEKDFNSSEIEDVLEMWQDVTQDINLIAKELEMSLEKVKSILKHLQEEGDIDNYQIDSKVEESVDPKTKKIMSLSQFQGRMGDKKYFFKIKPINKFWDSHIIFIESHQIEYLEEANPAVKIDLTVSYKNQDYDIFIYYNWEDEVFYGSKEGKDTVQELRDNLGDNIELFDQMTSKILDEVIPSDFWEVRRAVN